MRIDGVNQSSGLQLPRHIASAYGMKARAASRNDAIDAPLKIQKAETIGAQRLIAGHVRGSVGFEGTTATPSSQPERPRAVLQLYTRAADRIEAAIGVELGRGLDVKG